VKKPTNLEKLCAGLKWSGGTIHQVSAELSRYCSPELCRVENLLELNDPALKLILFLYENKKESKNEK
jgi:hypothetical protein